jgi:c-di-AMP phosphodiesterase-like protein
MLLGINKICEIREKLSVFGTRYLLGELRVVYLTFTILLVIILTSFASYSGLVRLLSIFLIYVVIFSTFYVFHVDRMFYSEQVVKNTTLDQTISYIKTNDKI